MKIEEQPYDDRDREPPCLDPVVERARHLTQPATPPAAAPSPFIVPVPAETMRAAIKDALNSLLMIDLVNDEADETYAKLRTIASGLIEAL